MREYWGLGIGDRGLGDWPALAMKVTTVAVCLLVAGCTGDEADRSTTSSTATTDNGGNASTETSTATGGESTTDATLDPSSIPRPELSPESPETLRARELFASLLGTLSPEAWNEAQLELEGLGPAVTPVLIDALQSEDRIEREMAAQELVMLVLDVSDYQTELLAALGDPSEQVRGVCAVALLTQSPESAEPVIAALIDVLDTPDPSLHEMAAVNLTTFPEVVVGQLPQVLAALEDAPPRVAVPLIEALAAAGSQANAASETLRKLAAGDDAEIAAAANQALDAVSGPAE